MYLNLNCFFFKVYIVYEEMLARRYSVDCRYHMVHKSYTQVCWPYYNHQL